MVGGGARLADVTARADLAPALTTDRSVTPPPPPPPPPSRPFTVSVEGNVGSGKSTFLRHFQQLEGVHVIEEQLDKWRDVDGHNLLQMLYQDPGRWSFLFQSYIQLFRLQVHLDTTPCRVKIIERSLQNNRHVFVECAAEKESIKPPEFAVLADYFDLLERDMNIDVDLIVYLRSTPEVVHERMRRRARPEEAGVPLSYLRQLHGWHERWLMGDRRASRPRLLVVDADQSLQQLSTLYDRLQHQVLGHVR